MKMKMKYGNEKYKIQMRGSIIKITMVLQLELLESVEIHDR